MKVSLLLDAFKHSQTTKQLNDHLRCYLLSFGIKSWAVTCYSGAVRGPAKLLYDYATSPLIAWHRYYLSEGYAEVDKTLVLSSLQLQPIYWSVPEQFSKAKNTKEHTLREESLAYGIDKGLSLPVYDVNGDVSILVLHQQKAETTLLADKELGVVWLGVAQHYFHHLKRLLQMEKVVSVKLTAREKKCLLLTGQGFSVNDIASMLHIKERTVHFHCQNANKKLGTHNKYLSYAKLQEK